ncbi:MAG: hypothetical protein M3Q10_12015 [Chloroflexota bacterium]|nr:hypothetical protein [Chloroflexota bacterium]
MSVLDDLDPELLALIRAKQAKAGEARLAAMLAEAEAERRAAAIAEHRRLIAAWDRRQARAGALRSTGQDPRNFAEYEDRQTGGTPGTGGICVGRE